MRTMGSPTFQWVSAELERGTTLLPGQAAEALRLALRKAGLTPPRVTRDEMVVVLRRVLPRQLAFAGVDDSVTYCERLARTLVAEDLPRESVGVETVEDVFRRLFEGQI